MPPVAHTPGSPQEGLSMSTTLRIVAVGLAFFASATAAVADDRASARHEAQRLAALVALRNHLARGDCFKVSQEELVRIIRADLPGQRRPALDKARAELRGRFDAVFDRLLEQVIEPLSPADRARLRPILRASCARRQPGQK